MIIHFSPIRMDAALSAEVRDGLLVVNGSTVDPDRPESDWVVGSDQTDGLWQVTLLLPYGPGAGPAVLFPQPVEMSQDGPVPLPGQARG